MWWNGDGWGWEWWGVHMLGGFVLWLVVIVGAVVLVRTTIPTLVYR